MKKIIILICLLGFVIASFATCGESGTGVSNPPSVTTKQTASAAAALFSSNENAGLTPALRIPLAVMDVLVKKAMAQQGGEEGGCGTNDPACTCSSLNESANEDHPEISDAAFAAAGTYGSAENGITLTADDFCTQPDGTNNTGDGPDGKGLFAAFTLTGDVTGTCTGDSGSTTIAFKENSAGLWRNTLAEGTTPAYEPQIHGSFVMGNDGSAVTVDCTLFLLSDESVAFADCSDENGETIEQETNTTCSF